MPAEYREVAGMDTGAKTAEKTIWVRMMGGFSLWEDGRLLSLERGKNGKIWNLLAYLIFHRYRVLAPGELPELLCRDEKIEDPDNVVKNLVYRLRKQLQALGLDGSRCILQQGGVYGWNPEIRIQTDTEEFIRLYREAGLATPDREKTLDCYLRAASLYQGFLLPGLVYEEWTISHRVYYHQLFISCIREMEAMCRTPEEQRELIVLCEKGIAIDPTDEELYRVYIRQLLARDRTTDAKNAYEMIVRRLYREVGVPPSQELQALYRSILHQIHGVEMDLQRIRGSLRESGSIHGSFCTDYGVFQDICRFISRSAGRRNQKALLQLWTVSFDGEERARGSERIVPAMDHLREAIRQALRRGDVFARYSISQYIIILQDAAEENAEMIGKRILALYNDRIREERAEELPTLSFRMLPLSD